MLQFIRPSLKPSGARDHQANGTPVLHRCDELSTRLHAYIFRQRLGRGAFGQVFLAEINARSKSGHGDGCKHGRRLVAIKIVRRSLLGKESTRALARAEAENLRRASESGSSFFTQLRETFCDAHNLYIVTDYVAGGTLRDEMRRRRRNGGIPNDRIVLIMAQLVEALAQLRALRIVHRDIKPDNILIDALGNIVIADFGLSRRFEMTSSEEFNVNEDGKRERSLGSGSAMHSSLLHIFKLRREKDEESKRVECDSKETREKTSADAISCLTDTGCGTLAYAAPEMHRGEAYSFAADVYSLGVVFHELLLDHLPPYPPASPKSIKTCSAAWFLDTKQNRMVPITIKPVALDLLTSLMALDSLKRITFPELRVHPFFKGVHWPTLATKAYTLPTPHAPPKPPLKLACRWMINPGIFVDPLVVPEDGPSGELEEVYNTQVSEDLRKKRGLSDSGAVSKMMQGIRSTVLRVQDITRRRERRVKKRDWAKDVSYGKSEPFVKIASPRDVLPSEPRERNANVEIRIEVDMGREETCNIPRSNTSVAADTGHNSPSVPHKSEVLYVAVPPSGSEKPSRILRRVTKRISSKLRILPPSQAQRPNITQAESASDMRSIIAIFSRSLSNLESPERVNPPLSRLSNDVHPHSPESSSSSSPFPSSYSLSLFLTRALEHILPSSHSLSLRHPSSKVAKTEIASGVRASARSSCPSLLPSSSCTTAASSSLPVTPIRGNSHLTGFVDVHTFKSGSMRSGLPYTNDDRMHRENAFEFLSGSLTTRRRIGEL